MDQPPPSDVPDESLSDEVPEGPVIESYRRGRKAASGVVAGAALVAGAAFAFARYHPARIEVEGVSMAPTLLPGDWALVVTPERFHRDDVVVVEHPQRPGYEIVKRLVGVPGSQVAGRELGEDATSAPSPAINSRRRSCWCIGRSNAGVWCGRSAANS
jgi:hypothetical protein